MMYESFTRNSSAKFNLASIRPTKAKSVVELCIPDRMRPNFLTKICLLDKLFYMDGTMIFSSFKFNF